jgi:hypothetical protein
MTNINHDQLVYDVFDSFNGNLNLESYNYIITNLKPYTHWSWTPHKYQIDDIKNLYAKYIQDNGIKLTPEFATALNRKVHCWDYEVPRFDPFIGEWQNRGLDYSLMKKAAEAYYVVHSTGLVGLSSIGGNWHDRLYHNMNVAVVDLKTGKIHEYSYRLKKNYDDSMAHDFLSSVHEWISSGELPSVMISNMEMFMNESSRDRYRNNVAEYCQVMLHRFVGYVNNTGELGYYGSDEMNKLSYAFAKFGVSTKFDSYYNKAMDNKWRPYLGGVPNYSDIWVVGRGWAEVLPLTGGTITSKEDIWSR